MVMARGNEKERLVHGKDEHRYGSPLQYKEDVERERDILAAQRQTRETRKREGEKTVLASDSRELAALLREGGQVIQTGDKQDSKP